MVEADCTTCYTVADFAREYPRGVYVLGCSGHVLSRHRRCVVGQLGQWRGALIYYWYKEE